MHKKIATLLLPLLLASSVQSDEEIHPSFGNIMLEFGTRYSTLYYSAKADNYQLANYQLHELKEALEVAEHIRPKYEKKLKRFEHLHLQKLENALKKRNFTIFKKVYFRGLQACNECHTQTGHPYIRYKLPQHGVLFLEMQLQR